MVVSGPRVINQGRTGRMNERRVRKEGKKKRREEKRDEGVMGEEKRR